MDKGLKSFARHLAKTTRLYASSSQLDESIRRNRERQVAIQAKRDELERALRTCPTCGPFPGSACECGETFIL